MAAISIPLEVLATVPNSGTDSGLPGANARTRENGFVKRHAATGRDFRRAMDKVPLRKQRYLTQMTEAFDLYVKACSAWAQAHGVAPEDASQWVMRASRTEQAGAAAAPASYNVAGFTPTQTILELPEEVTPEHTQIAKQMVAKRVARNAAEHRKPQLRRMTQSQRTRNVQKLKRNF